MFLSGLWARIECNSKRLEEYHPVKSADHRTVTCYVNTQAGQEFFIECGSTSGDWEETVRFRLFADGHLMDSRFLMPVRNSTYLISRVRVSATEHRSFKFADYSGKAIEDFDMDDDNDAAEMRDPLWSDKGRITLELDRVKVTYTGDMVRARFFDHDADSMRTVKVGDTYQIEGDTAMIPGKQVDLIEDRFAVFQWQHRDRDFLEGYQFIPSSENSNASPIHSTILPQFAEMSLNARALSVDALTSGMTGMNIDNTR